MSREDDKKKKKKKKKKQRQSIIEKELMSIVSKSLKQCVDKALDDIFKDFKTWIVIIVAPFLICLPDILAQQLMYVFSPNPSEYIYKYRKTEEFSQIMSKDNEIIRKLSRSFKNSVISRAHSNYSRNRNKGEMINDKSKDEIDNYTNCPLNVGTSVNNVMDELNNGRGKGYKLNKDYNFKALNICPDMYGTKNQLSENTEVQIESGAGGPNEILENGEEKKKKTSKKKKLNFL